MSTHPAVPEPICPYCGGTKEYPNDRGQISPLFPYIKCASKFHLKVPEQTWEEFKADRERRRRMGMKLVPHQDPQPPMRVLDDPEMAPISEQPKKRVRPSRSKKRASGQKEDFPDIILYLMSIPAIVEVDEASKRSGISKAVLSRGKDPSLNGVAVLKWKRRKFFFVDTLPKKSTGLEDGARGSEEHFSGHLSSYTQ